MKLTTLPGVQAVKDAICEYVQENLTSITSEKGNTYFAVKGNPPTITVGPVQGQLKAPCFFRLEAADAVAMATKSERTIASVDTLPEAEQEALLAKLMAKFTKP